MGEYSMSSFAFTSTKWALKLVTKLAKADVRMHNLDVIEDDMSILFCRQSLHTP